MKYVVVIGGVVSGLGKGVTASSIGVLLKACGLRVTSIKIDPYLNIDAGTISPSEHGEVFVLDDGSEVDLDLGNYERFLDIQLRSDNNITNGKIFKSVLEKERRGEYLGQTVQIAKHVTKAVQEWIKGVAMVPVDGREGPADVCIIELGGTIGDIESMIFTEALSHFSDDLGSGNFCLVHVSFVPVLNVVGEQVTIVIVGKYTAEKFWPLNMPVKTMSPILGSKTHMGGTMRLGSRRTFFKTTDCKSARLYGDVNYVDERHRHRYEVNPEFVPIFENARLQFVGRDETGRRMEIIEVPHHPFFVGVQFHPEFKSRPSKPSALFVGLVAASSGQLERLLDKSGNGDTTAATKRPLSDGFLAPSLDENGRTNKQCTDPSNGTCDASGEEGDRA